MLSGSLNAGVYGHVFTKFLIIHRPKFRNYRPEQEALLDSALPDAEPGDVESEVKEQLESAKTRGIIEELVCLLSHNLIALLNL